MLDERGAEETALTWYYRAWAYEKIGRPQEADRAYRRSLALEGDRRDTLLDYASFCCRHAMRESFDELYPKMLESLGEHDSDVWTHIGNFLSVCGLDDKDLLNAIEAYDRAIDAGGDPNFITLKKLRVSAQRDGESCRDEVLGMLKRDDLDALSWNELGLICLYLSDSDNAMRCFTKALESIPDDSVIAANVIYALLNTYKYEDAIAFGREWLLRKEAKPSADFWSQLADAYYNIADDINCEACLRKASELDPGNEYYASRIVNTLAMQGKAEEAIGFGMEFCRKAYERNAESDPAVTMMGTLSFTGSAPKRFLLAKSPCPGKPCGGFKFLA
jgi:tetratricopeptide (TPR) repeat protein